MTFTQACFLFLIAWISGVLNSVAGGGGLIIFPALMLAGLPSISANATSTIASWPGLVAGVSAYYKELQPNLHLFLLFSSVSFMGGLLGAMLLLHTPTTIFDYLVPYLLLFTTLLFTFSNSLTFGKANKDTRHSLLKALVIYFFVAIYGGFYGLGITFLMLAVMGMLGMKNIHEMNALKTLLMSCIDSFAAFTFILAGVVAWPQSVLMMLGTVIGGYSGAYYSRQLDPRLVRRFVIVIAWGITCYFFLFRDN